METGHPEYRTNATICGFLKSTLHAYQKIDYSKRISSDPCIAAGGKTMKILKQFLVDARANS